MREEAHTHEEIRRLVAPEVAARPDSGKVYGICYYNVTRRKTRQVAELAAGGGRTYVKEWMAVPVVDSGIPRELVDAARIASMYNYTNRMSLACGMIPNEEYHALAR